MASTNVKKNVDFVTLSNVVLDHLVLAGKEPIDTVGGPGGYGEHLITV